MARAVGAPAPPTETGSRPGFDWKTAEEEVTGLVPPRFVPAQPADPAEAEPSTWRTVTPATTWRS